MSTKIPNKYQLEKTTIGRIPTGVLNSDKQTFAINKTNNQVTIDLGDVLLKVPKSFGELKSITLDKNGVTVEVDVRSKSKPSTSSGNSGRSGSTKAQANALWC